MMHCLVSRLSLKSPTYFLVTHLLLENTSKLKLLIAVDNRKVSPFASIDLSAAFDTVDHSILNELHEFEPTEDRFLLF